MVTLTMVPNRFENRATAHLIAFKQRKKMMAGGKPISADSSTLTCVIYMTNHPHQQVSIISLDLHVLSLSTSSWIVSIIKSQLSSSSSAFINLGLGLICTESEREEPNKVAKNLLKQDIFTSSSVSSSQILSRKWCRAGGFMRFILFATVANG